MQLVKQDQLLGNLKPDSLIQWLASRCRHQMHVVAPIPLRRCSRDVGDVLEAGLDELSADATALIARVDGKDVEIFSCSC